MHLSVWFHGGLNFLAFFLFTLVAVLWWPYSKRRGAIVFTAIASLAFTWGIFHFLDPTDIPIDWVTPLQEGRSQKNILQVFGSAAHAKSNYRFFITTLVGEDGIRSTLRMNFWLFGLSLLLYWCIARHLLQSFWSTIPALLIPVFNLVGVHLPLSAQPAALIGLYLSMAFVAGGLFEKLFTQEPSKRSFTWVPLLLLGILGVLLTKTRPELGLIPFSALGMALLRLHFGDEKLSHFLSAFLRWGHRLLKTPWIWALLLLNLLTDHVRQPVAWGLKAIEPLNLSPLTLPFVMMDLLFPFAVSVLFILGIVYSTRHWKAHLLLPLSTLVVYRAYYEAACSVHFELMRYLGYLLAPISILALLGVLELKHIFHRLGLGSRWRSLAFLALLLSGDLSSRPTTEHAAFIDSGESDLSYRFPLSRDIQRETRFVLKAVEDFPDCLILAKTSKQRRYRDGQKEVFHYLAFGGPYQQSTKTFEAETVLDALAQARPSSCNFFYRSLDCNLVGAEQACEETNLRPRPVREERFPRNQYNNPYENGATLPVVTLGLYEIDTEKPKSAPPAPAASAPPIPTVGGLD